MGKHIFLIAAFMVMIFSASLVQIGFEPGADERLQVLDLFKRKPTVANLRAYEKDMEEVCWLARKLRPRMQYLQFVVLKEAGNNAFVGREGWFFYKDGIRYLVESWPKVLNTKVKESDAISVIVDFHNQLAERGIQLLVVPVPGKGTVYPEMLTARAKRLTKPVNARTREMVSRLEKSGIDVVDLTGVFFEAKSSRSEDDPPLYLLQDTHWSAEGAQLAAKAVGEKILTQGWIEKGDVEYDLKPVAIERYGDLLKRMQVKEILNCFTREEIQCEQVILRNNGELYHDDEQSEILVLGDSFLRVYEQDEPKSAGFIAHLARELRKPLASIVNDGGASTLVRQDLSRRPELLSHKRVVVWEFIERDIRFGTEGWQKVKLP